MTLSLVLIEDHQALREGLELLLGREGLEVVGAAGSAREGRELIERSEPDVALVDIRLGEDSGMASTRVHAIAIALREGFIQLRGADGRP